MTSSIVPPHHRHHHHHPPLFTTTHPHIHHQPHRSYTMPSTPIFHPPRHTHHIHHHSSPIPPYLTHSTSYPASSSHIITTPTSTLAAKPQPHSLSTKGTSLARPSPCKKPSSSTIAKQKSVQLSLELKVERAKGFHAFFVPLARTLPPAPPSSPVLAARQIGPNELDTPPTGFALDGGFSGHCSAGSARGVNDYFSGWDKPKVAQREQWVEDVGEDSSGMEVDSE